MAKKVLNITCNLCDDTKELIIYEEDYQRFQTGTKVQLAFPYLSADDRELLTSGTCGACFDKLFGEKG